MEKNSKTELVKWAIFMVVLNVVFYLIGGFLVNPYLSTYNSAMDKQTTAAIESIEEVIESSNDDDSSKEALEKLKEAIPKIGESGKKAMALSSNWVGFMLAPLMSLIVTIIKFFVVKKKEEEYSLNIISFIVTTASTIIGIVLSVA